MPTCLTAWSSCLTSSSFPLGCSYKLRSRVTSSAQSATYNGHLAVTRLLLEHNMNINMAGEWSTALHHATQREDEEMVWLLLKREELDPNIPNSHGCTALDWAVCNENLPILRLLLQRKDIRVNREDQSKVFLLYCAIAAGCYDMIWLLLKHHAINPNKICGSSSTLSYTASMRLLDIVNIILADEWTLPNCDYPRE